MLVLSRKLGERIVIGDDIVITVLAGAGDRVRVGITAPDGVPIHREELLRRMRQKSNTQRTSDRKSPRLAEIA